MRRRKQENKTPKNPPPRVGRKATPTQKAEARARVLQSRQPTVPRSTPVPLSDRIPDPLELIMRKTVIVRMMNACKTNDEICEVLCERGMAREIVIETINRLKQERWQILEEDRVKMKSEQVARLQADLALMREMKPKVPFATIRGHEELIAQLVGTKEPVKQEMSVMVDHRHALWAVIQHMDDSTIEDITQDQLLLENEARSTRALRTSFQDGDRGLIRVEEQNVALPQKN
jgi:hypothetical protein